MIVNILIYFSVIAWISIGIISDSAALYRFKTIEVEAFNQEISHDDENVQRIIAFESDTLLLVQKHIEMRMERLKARMIMLIGGPDKLAVFALGGMGLSVLKDLDKYSPLLDSNIFMLICFLFFGFGAGGMLLNHLLGLYAYQKDIISLALMRKSVEVSLTV